MFLAPVPFMLSAVLVFGSVERWEAAGAVSQAANQESQSGRAIMNDLLRRGGLQRVDVRFVVANADAKYEELFAEITKGEDLRQVKSLLSGGELVTEKRLRRSAFRGQLRLTFDEGPPVDLVAMMLPDHVAVKAAGKEIVFKIDGKRLTELTRKVGKTVSPPGPLRGLIARDDIERVKMRLNRRLFDKDASGYVDVEFASRDRVSEFLAILKKAQYLAVVPSIEFDEEQRLDVVVRVAPRFECRIFAGVRFVSVTSEGETSYYGVSAPELIKLCMEAVKSE